MDCEQQNTNYQSNNKEDQEEESSRLSHMIARSLQPAANKAHIDSVSS